MKQSRELEQQHLRQVRRLWKELLAQKIVSTFYPYSLISFFFTSRIKLLFLFFSKHIFCFLFFVFCSLFFYFIKLLPLIAFIFSSIHPSIHPSSLPPSLPSIILPYRMRYQQQQRKKKKFILPFMQVFFQKSI